MVKHHRYGAIGHVKHGQGELVNVPGATDAAAAASAVTPPVLQDHSTEPEDKRQRLEDQPGTSCAIDSQSVTSCAIDVSSLAALFGNPVVTCTVSMDEVLRGGSFSLAVNGASSDTVHGAVIQLVCASYMLGLDLTGNRIEDADVRALASALSSRQCRLASLTMKWVGMGPELSHAFAEALKLNTSLTSLNMERNGLAWSGGRAFGEALAANATLRHFDMSLNDVGPEGGRAVAQALDKNRSLVELTMVRCGMGPEG
eukprot:6331866-Prymnesium_polylepis.3